MGTKARVLPALTSPSLPSMVNALLTQSLENEWGTFCLLASSFIFSKLYSPGVL